MPRRVYTYPAGMGWDGLNLLSTIGAFMLACGILVFLVDIARNMRLTGSEPAGNVWGAGTLEWLPNHTFAARSTPRVSSREPLWSDHDLARDVEAGRYYLPGTATGARETIVSSAVDATPQYLMRLPGPGWAHLSAAVFTAGFFLLLTVKAVVLATICGVLAVASIIVWMWESDPPPTEPVDIGGGVLLPTYASGSQSHSWWAMVILMLVAAALYASYVFGYLYLWTVSPGIWPKLASVTALAGPLAAAGALLASAAALWAATRMLARGPASRVGLALLILMGMGALLAALYIDVLSHWRGGLRPQADSHAAMVYANAALQAQIVGAVLVMALFAVARILLGRLDRIRRVVFDNLALFWAYAIGQAALGLVLTHGFPRLVGS
jgi:cytochrome c oxidase subunit I+III